MKLSRRHMMLGFICFLLPSTTFAHKGRKGHRHVFRGVRRPAPRYRRIWRRRVRRPVYWRGPYDRRLLVVPLALAVGWELMIDGRVVVVNEVRKNTIVVQHDNGHQATIEVHREDTKENTRELEGSEYEATIEE